MSKYGIRMSDMGTHTFLFTNISMELQKDLVTKVKNLGGSCIDSNGFVKNISHLVCGSLKKTEKFFGACISGKWIISPQFILDSHKVGMWLDEDNYLFRVENKDPMKDHLALAARRWRTQVHSFKIVPFQDWRIALLMTAERAAVFKRLLRYGGAEILKLSLPFSKCAKIRYISYVFVDSQHTDYVPELQELGLLCLKEKYLGDFVLKDPPPDPFDYIVVEESMNKTLLDNSVGAESEGSKLGKKPVANQSSSSAPLSRKETNSSVVSSCTESSQSSVTPATDLKISHKPQIGNAIERKEGNQLLSSTPDSNYSMHVFDRVEVSDALLKGSRNNGIVPKCESIPNKQLMNSRASLGKDWSNIKLLLSTPEVKPSAVMDHANFSQPKGSKNYRNKPECYETPNKQVKLEGDDSTSKNSQIFLDKPHKKEVNETFKLTNQHLDNIPKNMSNPPINASQTSDSPYHVIDSISQLSKHTEKGEPIIVQENDIVSGTKLSRAVKKSALEYLDPNLPLVHSQSSRYEDQRRQKLSTNSKCKDQSLNDFSLSAKLKLQKGVKTTPGSAQKRKLESDEDKRKHSKSNKRGDTSNVSVSVNIYLHNHQCTPVKNAVDTAYSNCNPPLLNSDSDAMGLLRNEDSYSGHVIETRVLSSQNATPPKSSHRNVKSNQSVSGLTNVVQNSDFRTPEKKHLNEQSTPHKLISPSASLTLSPNVYLYGLSPSQNGSTGQHSAEKKVSTQKNLPASEESSVKSDASREKRKSIQSSLQQFGFRSVNKDKTGQTSTLKPETVSPHQTDKKVKPPNNRQLFHGPNSLDGETIVIRSDDEEEGESIPSKAVITTTQCDVTVVSSSEEDSVQVIGSTFDRSKRADVISILSSTDDDERTDNDGCVHEMSASKLSRKGNINVPSSSKAGKHARNVFEDVLQPILDTVDHARDEGDSENDQRNALAAKRKLFQPQHPDTSSGCSKMNSHDLQDIKDISVRLVRCDLVLGKGNSYSYSGKCLVNGGNSENSETCKGFCCNRTENVFKTPFTQHECEASSSGNIDENSLKMDQLPHVLWPSSFTNHVASHAAEAEKQFVPSIVSQCMESSRENGFFNTVLDHGRPTLARMPNVHLLCQLIHLLACDDVAVKNQAFSDLMLWAQKHPPTTNSAMTKVYSDLFELSTDQTLLCNLLQGLTDPQEFYSKVGVLEFIVPVFEMNFSSCVHSKDRKTLKECMLIKWLWSHSQAIHHNSKTKQLLRVFEAVLSQSTLTVTNSMITLISMVAECFRLSFVHWNTQNRHFLSDTITSFAMDITKIIRDAFPDREPFYITSHILSFKPAWLRTMITASMLYSFNDYLLNKEIEVGDISLTTIVSQYFFLLPPLSCQQHNTIHKSTVLSMASQQQDGDSMPQPQVKNLNSEGSLYLTQGKNLTATKINKTNGKGESALHIAARKGDVLYMKKLLSIPGIDVNLKDYNGWTPLHEACNHGRLTCVELLLKYVPPYSSVFLNNDGISSKVDVNAFADQKITPLHDAVLNNRVEICKLLLKFGGEHILQTKTVKGYTALDLASTKEMMEVLSAGENCNVHNSLNYLNLSQDSQSEDSLNQSDFIKSACKGISLPSDYKYEQVLNADGIGGSGVLSANFSNCSLFVSLITLLLNSYFEASSVMMPSTGGGPPTKLSLFKTNESAVFKRMRVYFKVFRKHLRKITTLETFDLLEPQLVMLVASISGQASQK